MQSWRAGKIANIAKNGIGLAKRQSRGFIAPLSRKSLQVHCEHHLLEALTPGGGDNQGA